MIGYAIVNLQDGTIDTTYSFPLTGSPPSAVAVFHDEGYTWETVGWTDGVRKLVELERSQPLSSDPLVRAVSQLPRFDGEKAIIDVTFERISSDEAALIIAAKAGEIILSRYPDWKQRNMTAQGVSLVEKQAAGVELTAADLQAKTDIEGVWSWIGVVRAYSNSLTDAFTEGKTVDLVVGSIDGSGEWPT